MQPLESNSRAPASSEAVETRVEPASSEAVETHARQDSSSEIVEPPVGANSRAPASSEAVETQRASRLEFRNSRAPRVLTRGARNS